MNGSVSFAITLLAIAQIVALVAGQARFYALCLDITLKNAYFFLFLPIITLVVISFLLMIGILPPSLSDELYAISTFAGQLVMLSAVYKLMKGSCSTSLRLDETPTSA